MLIALELLIGLVLLVVGAELLVRGASKLALAAGVAPLVIGLTVVAFGTSAPELAVIILPIALTEREISRIEGGLLVAAYIGYVSFVIVSA